LYDENHLQKKEDYPVPLYNYLFFLEIVFSSGQANCSVEAEMSIAVEDLPLPRLYKLSSITNK
jgi:hypothetical protein